MESEAHVALVSGASMGIGLAIAQRLAADGFRVALMARESDELDGAVRTIGSDRAIAVQCDLTDPDQPAASVGRVVAWGGRLDVLVNSASATKNGDVFALSDEEWVTGFQVKVFGALRLVRAAWPHLRATRGNIVNIAGVGSRTPKATVAMTSALSSSLIALTKVFADKGVAEGVRVNAINPGPVMTPRILETLDARAKANGTTREALIAGMVRDNAITRVGQPEDVAELVSFILSPGAELLHGAIIELDGGMTKGL